MKLSLIHSVGLIAKAISTSVRKQGFQFSRKQEMMGVMTVGGWLYSILLCACSLCFLNFL